VFSRAAQKAGEIPPPSGSREHPSVPVQPFSPEHEAALHLSRMRVFLATRSARRAPRQAAHRTQEAPRRLPTAHGMDHTTPAFAGAGILPASACAMTGPLQLLWRARERPLASPLFPLGDGLDVHMAQSAGRQAEQLHVGAVYPRPRPRQDSASSYYGGSTSESVCLKAGLCIAEASTTEEPDAGKLHVRDCTGGCRVTGIPTVEASAKNKDHTLTNMYIMHTLRTCR
jgi:hypothetical protein